MVRIGSRGGQQDSILGGKAQASRRGHVGTSIRKVRKPRAIQPKSLMQITVDQRQQCRPRLTWRPGFLSNLPPQEEVGQLQGLTVWLTSSGSQSDAVALRLEQGDPCYGSLFAVKPDPFGFTAFFDRLDDVVAGESPEVGAAELRAPWPEPGAFPVEVSPVGTVAIERLTSASFPRLFSSSRMAAPGS